MFRHEVNICVLCHNRQDVTARFLPNLADHLALVDARIWLLDNGSSDETWRLLKWFRASTRPWGRRRRLKFKTFRLEENRGFAGGNNYLAAKGKAKYICFINNDAFPDDPRWLEELLINGASHDGVGATGPISDAVMGIQHRVWNDRWPIWHKAQALSGFCLVMRRSIFEEMEGWDERFFNGDEDIDLSIRLRKAGYELRVNRSVFIHHECSQSLAPWCAINGESIKAHFDGTRELLIEKHGWQCQNDIGFWEHLDRPESEWAEMGVMPNGEYYQPPGDHGDQIRAIAKNAVSAGRPQRLLSPDESRPAAPGAEEESNNGRAAEGQFHPGGPKGNWAYHIGTLQEGGVEGFIYAGHRGGESCPLGGCPLCGVGVGEAGVAG